MSITMKDIKTRCLKTAIRFIKNELNSNFHHFQITYEGRNRETGENVVYLIHEDYLNAEVPGGHNQSRVLYISDQGIVMRALKWQ